jgi:hypothetical protein
MYIFPRPQFASQIKDGQSPLAMGFLVWPTGRRQPRPGRSCECFTNAWPKSFKSGMKCCGRTSISVGRGRIYGYAPLGVGCALHPHLFWIAALLLALVDLPDFGTRSTASPVRWRRSPIQRGKPARLKQRTKNGRPPHPTRPSGTFQVSRRCPLRSDERTLAGRTSTRAGGPRRGAANCCRTICSYSQK